MYALETVLAWRKRKFKMTDREVKKDCCSDLQLIQDVLGILWQTHESAKADFGNGCKRQNKTVIISREKIRTGSFKIASTKHDPGTKPYPSTLVKAAVPLLGSVR